MIAAFVAERIANYLLTPCCTSSEKTIHRKFYQITSRVKFSTEEDGEICVIDFLTDCAVGGWGGGGLRGVEVAFAAAALLSSCCPSK